MIDTLDTCSRCGWPLVGDGYATVLHCENADGAKVAEAEPDAPVILCEPEAPCSQP